MTPNILAPIARRLNTLQKTVGPVRKLKGTVHLPNHLKLQLGNVNGGNHLALVTHTPK